MLQYRLGVTGAALLLPSALYEQEVCHVENMKNNFIITIRYVVVVELGRWIGGDSIKAQFG